MTLILTNEEIENIFTLDECFDVLEPALLDLGNGAAVNMPRQDLLVPGPVDDSYHGLKTSCASLPRAGVTTMRLTSDVLTWPIVDGKQRRVKMPLANGNKYVGLIFVFSTATGELLAIFPDGLIQAIRVGVTNALSAKYLARQDSSVMALYGSGWQAGPALTAMCKVLPIKEVRVFSPTEKNREAFVQKMSATTNAKVRAVSSPVEVARGADIVSLATNALDPFFSSAWISDGMHITTVRPSEMTFDALVRCDLIAVSTREAAKLFTIPGEESKVPEFGKGDYGRAELANTAADWRNKPELSEIMAGKAAGRSGDAAVTCMLNHLGLGLQFSAAAARVYELAKARGLGRELPAEWFCQSEHS
jgi:ornithine cyclodeaminase/alanine dehydrogenase-like protein (mu-crystallin family)